MNERTNRNTIRFKTIEFEGKQVIEYIVDDLTNEELQTHFNRAYVKEDWLYCRDIAKEAKRRGFDIEFTEEPEPLSVETVPEEIIDDKSQWDKSQIYRSQNGEMVNIYVNGTWVVFVRHDVVNKVADEIINYNFRPIENPTILMPNGQMKQVSVALIPKRKR